jgi:hypothetical protein
MKMMRRFSRKRRPEGEAPRGGVDAKGSLEKILALGILDAKTLEPAQPSDVPDTVALIGRGERADGSAILVASSPKSATEALLGALAAANPGADESPFAGTVYVVAPQWPAGARRILALLGRTGYTIEPIAAAQLSEARVLVEAEPELPILATGYAQLAARMGSAEARAAFTRAATVLEGLAAKHGGTVRAGADRLELVVAARRAAEIRTDRGTAVLETQLGGRQSTPLGGADLAGVLDGLEGQIRRRLGDRKVREGEEGLRGRVVSQLAAGDELRGLRPWPQPGMDLDPIDAVAVNAEGEPVVVAVREEIGWSALAAVLESLAPLAPLFPVLFAEVGPPLRLGTARLLLVGERIGAGLERALSGLTIAYELRTVGATSGPAIDLVARGSGEGAEDRPARRGRRRGGRSGRGGTAEGRGRSSNADASDAGTSTAGEAASPSGPARPSGPAGPRADQEAKAAEDDNSGRSRRRRRPRRARGEEGEASETPDRKREAGASEDRPGGDGGGAGRSRRFEEISLMDLDDSPGSSGSGSEGKENSGGRPRRGRRRGRRNGAESGSRSDSGSASGASEDDSEPAPRVEEEDLVDSDDLEEILARLADDAPDYDADETTEPTYEDDEDGNPATEEVRQAPRRRAAIVVHADRDSLVSAMLLARDIRQIDGIWVYPQSELMTFFRSIATDLRDDTSIILVGFSPSPAFDVVQAASLYRGRLSWFDRQVWPPEDLMALREALGADAVHAGEEIDSSLPLVLESSSRRSRFSDKLVDLATGRFTQHDFERWGRLWWWRIGEIAKKSGDVRADVAPILTGRPSDLTKEAALIDVPAAPEEVAYVAAGDFRLVHFGGHVLVDVAVEDPFDLHLCGRIARERYGATLSLTHRVGGEVFALGGDELIGKRALDYQAVVEHLVNKLEWIEARPDSDHVARFRVRDLASHPERLEELMGEIAMGRALLER